MKAGFAFTRRHFLLAAVLTAVIAVAGVSTSFAGDEDHQFTVYSLDRFLPVVHTFGDFVPAGPEGLYQELIEASRHGHVLASASIAGFFSAADTK